MNYEQAMKMLKSCGQEHVLAGWKGLGKSARQALLAQVATIDPKNVKYCQAALTAGGAAADSSKGKAPKVAELKGAALGRAVAVGERELKAGRVAALLARASATTGRRAAIRSGRSPMRRSSTSTRARSSRVRAATARRFRST